MVIYLGVSDELRGVELNWKLKAFISEKKRTLLLRYVQENKRVTKVWN